MANTFISIGWVTRDVVQFYQNAISFVFNWDRELNDEFTTKGGAKVGYTVQKRIPQRFTVTEGQAFQPQNIFNQTVPVTINHQQNVAMGWSTADATMLVEDVRNRYTMPAGESLANKIDTTGGLEVYKSVYQSAGTPGTSITTNQTYLDAVARLRNQGVPTPLVGVLDPVAESKIVGANLTSFNPQNVIGDYYRSNTFGVNALGVQTWDRDVNMPVHTTGTFTSSTPLVNGASQTGSSLVTDGWGTGSLKAGDIFTVAGVNAVNPVSYADTGQLQQFVVTADVTFAAGAATISISPSIITSGQLQTVTAAPADDAVITVNGATSVTNGTLATTTSRQSFIFNSQAFALVMVDLDDDLPGAVVKRVRSREAAVSIRGVSQYALANDQKGTRFDVLYCTAGIFPQYALRLFGA